MLASFDVIAQSIAQDNRSPNLGDVLVRYGGSQHNLPVKLLGNSLETTFAEVGRTGIMTFQVHDDEISGFRSAFINLPIEYLHHDDYINPRTIGSNLRKLVEEFHKKLPQLHVSLGWINTSEGGESRVQIFDGQHKAAAQVLLGVRSLPVRFSLTLIPTYC